MSLKVRDKSDITNYSSGATKERIPLESETIAYLIAERVSCSIVFTAFTLACSIVFNRRGRRGRRGITLRPLRPLRLNHAYCA